MEESQAILDEIRTILETARKETQMLYENWNARDPLRNLQRL